MSSASDDTLQLDEVELPDELRVVDGMDGCKMVVCGANRGHVFTLVQLLPGQPLRTTSQMRPHIGSVTQIVHTSDESLIFTAGSDGSIFAYSRGDDVPDRNAHFSDVQVRRARHIAKRPSVTGKAMLHALHTHLC